MGHVVALDDVAYLAHPVPGDSGGADQCQVQLPESFLREAQDLIMGIYQRLHGEGGVLLVSHTQPARTVEFVRADLASRVRSLAHYELVPLKDEDKKTLLNQRADQLGYTLDEAVLNYWFSHGPRGIGALLRDLEVLDTASLSRKNPVTIPLLKQVLNY